MVSAREEIVAKDPKQVWSEWQVDSVGRENADRELRPFVGLCVAIGLGLISWLLILQVFIAVSG